MSYHPSKGRAVDIDADGHAVIPSGSAPVAVRHGVCGYLLRLSQQREMRTEALCGEAVYLPERPQSRLPHCPACVKRAELHAQRCDCFKIYPASARMPRDERSTHAGR